MHYLCPNDLIYNSKDLFSNGFASQNNIPRCRGKNPLLSLV